MKNLFLNTLFLICSATGMTSCASDDDTTVKESSYEQYGETFANMPDREDAIIYQVNLRAFSEEGTINGVRDRLSHIKSLGANVVYLMPIYPVGQLNSVGELGSPYSVKDYKSVSSEYGTLEDLRALVEEAHAMDMAVILDWVANHSSWDNAWINNHPEWYLKDESGNITEPPGTGWNDVAQLDFDNSELRDAMIDAMSYWVYNANIDGFRCDYADGVQQSFWAEAITSIRSIKTQNMLMLAEGTRKNHFDVGFDFTFGFGYFDALKRVFSEGNPATSIQDVNASEYDNIYNNDYRIVRYTSNHDVNITDGTPIELFGGKPGSMATFVVAAYMKSMPMIYNGQEIGYTQRIPFFNHTPIDWSTADADMFAQYQQIIDFRKNSEAIKKGVYNGYSSNAVAAFTMKTDNETVLVLSNLTNSNVNYIVPASLSVDSWTNAFTEQSMTLNTEVTLSPYQYIVLKK
ncbi:alpha-amylase family glycosyl hydrolase [uncultured Winogradskyella sp.]|uniref:alpha-amylase family glycosyl hydrolase n=1 Tax=uncultured Winogradskyella sp. TaxID=395353 RepID=UPI002626729A|nr:alpha-amylase family glycosyl hydrolase [uncultured Winogradskyella sp.]